MAISKVPRRRAKEPRIMVAEPLLTVLLAKDNGHYCAKCPELDLVTELLTAEAALQDLIEAIRDYAKEYLQDRDRYTASPNRAHLARRYLDLAPLRRQGTKDAFAA